MNARIKFTDHLKLIRNIRTTGTVAPSSRSLIDRMLKPIDFEQARCIVELGPGNGCITQRLLESMRPDSVLLCFEVDQEFAARLKAIGDPRLIVLNDCASAIGPILQNLGIDRVDHVVSSLPLAIMGSEVVRSVISSVNEHLRPGGYFQQYQYSLKNYDDIKPIFPAARIRFTMRNMPPAFIYECAK